MRTRTALPLVGTVAAVIGLTVAVSLATARPSSPRPLPLAAGPGLPVVRVEPALGYTLTGALPTERPGDATVYLLSAGTADPAVVSALATALDAGRPARDGSGWRAGGLVVSGRPGQRWWWAPCAADLRVSDVEQVGCAVTMRATVGVAVSPGPSWPEPAPVPAPMPTTRVRTAAAPVLHALGLSLADARVESSPYGGSVTVSRTVGGLAASGMDTTVQVSQDGTVSGASGYLGTPQPGDDYPLVTAREAYGELPPLVQPMLMCPVSVNPADRGCARTAAPEVTGAHLGLVLDELRTGGHVLLPAWLFDLKGSSTPIPVVAVQPRYLPRPAQSGVPVPGAVPPAQRAPAAPGP